MNKPQMLPDAEGFFPRPGSVLFFIDCYVNTLLTFDGYWGIL